MESDKRHPAAVSFAAPHAVGTPSWHETLHCSHDQRAGSLSFPNWSPQREFPPMQPQVWQASKVPYVAMAALCWHCSAKVQSYVQAVRSRKVHVPPFGQPGLPGWQAPSLHVAAEGQAPQLPPQPSSPQTLPEQEALH